MHSFVTLAHVHGEPPPELRPPPFPRVLKIPRANAHPGSIPGSGTHDLGHARKVASRSWVASHRVGNQVEVLEQPLGAHHASVIRDGDEHE